MITNALLNLAEVVLSAIQTIDQVIDFPGLLHGTLEHLSELPG
jgi:uncharacterized protein YkvS